MNEPRLGPLLLLLLLAFTAACSRGSDAAPPLQGARLGGPFTLTDQNGRQVSDKQFMGKYRIVYFGYTFCPDVCPVDLQNIGKALRELDKNDPGRAARIQPIFITVDPERDTPAVMKQYVAAFHPRLIGLTGSRKQIDEVAKKFAMYGLKSEQEGSSEYLVNHTRMAILFGPKGEPIAPLRSEQSSDAVAADLRKWVA
jgi:protein SCO1/2